MRSSPARGAASAARTRSRSRTPARRSSSTTSAPRSPARATTTRPPSRSSQEIEAAGGEAAANGENVADFAGAERLVAQAIDTFGRLDILVNNAGILRDRMIVNMTEAEWDAVIAVHLKGHFAPTRHAAAYWRERSKAGDEVKGRVINTSSPSGVFGNVGQSNYGAAKAGIAGFTIIVAQELQRYGVTVNCLAPNARTRMTEDTFDMGAPPEGFDPLDPSNMSPLVVALGADEAQSITGQVFHVWGGAINALQGWSAGRALRLGREVGRRRAARRAHRPFPRRRLAGRDDRRHAGRGRPVAARAVTARRAPPHLPDAPRAGALLPGRSIRTKFS